MAQSATRKEKRRREALARTGKEPARASHPRNAAQAELPVLDGVVVSDTDDLPAVRREDLRPEKIDFTMLPGGLPQPDGAPPLVRRAKTVRVPGVLHQHIAVFQARHGGERYASFEALTLAMWRMLLAEEHSAIERARLETYQSGVPTAPVMGPFYRAAFEEMDRMHDES